MHIPRLATSLPHFTQNIGSLAERFDFDEVLIAGPVSSVAVDVSVHISQDAWFVY